MELIPNILLSVKPNKVITVVVEAILEHALTIVMRTILVLHNISLLMEHFHSILDVKMVMDATIPMSIAAIVLMFGQITTLVEQLMKKMSMPEMTFFKSLLFDT